MVFEGNKFNIESWDLQSQVLLKCHREGATVCIDNIEDAKLLITVLSKFIENKQFQQGGWSLSPLLSNLSQLGLPNGND